MINADQTGEKPLFRDKNWNAEARKVEKERKKSNWYKNHGNKHTGNGQKIEYKSVLFVPVTKGGILAKELRKREEEINRFSKERIKVVEDGGIKMKDFLVEKDPFPKLKCDKKKCLICGSEASEHLKISCNSNNVGYKLECDTCFENGQIRIYEGESSRSARVRGREHIADFENKRPNSVLYKHKENEHKNEEMKIRMEVTKKFKDPLTRQANEAVSIKNRKKLSF